MIVIGNGICQVGYLCFQAGSFLFDKAQADITQQPCIGDGAMLEYAFTGLESQIQTIKRTISLFQLINYSQALQIMFKTAKCLHAGIQGILTGMPKRGMAQIMRQRNGFDQIFIQA